MKAIFATDANNNFAVAKAAAGILRGVGVVTNAFVRNADSRNVTFANPSSVATECVAMSVGSPVTRAAKASATIAAICSPAREKGARILILHIIAKSVGALVVAKSSLQLAAAAIDDGEDRVTREKSTRQREGILT